MTTSDFKSVLSCQRKNWKNNLKKKIKQNSTKTKQFPPSNNQLKYLKTKSQTLIENWIIQKAKTHEHSKWHHPKICFRIKFFLFISFSQTIHCLSLFDLKFIDSLHFIFFTLLFYELPATQQQWGNNMMKTNNQVK